MCPGCSGSSTQFNKFKTKPHSKLHERTRLHTTGELTSPWRSLVNSSRGFNDFQTSCSLFTLKTGATGFFCILLWLFMLVFNMKKITAIRDSREEEKSVTLGMESVSIECNFCWKRCLPLRGGSFCSLSQKLHTCSEDVTMTTNIALTYHLFTNLKNQVMPSGLVQAGPTRHCWFRNPSKLERKKIGLFD